MTELEKRVSILENQMNKMVDKLVQVIESQNKEIKDLKSKIKRISKNEWRKWKI